MDNLLEVSLAFPVHMGGLPVGKVGAVDSRILPDIHEVLEVSAINVAPIKVD